VNGGIQGKYVHKKNRSHFLELKPDGNYLLFQGSASVTGRYEVNGDDILISIDDSTSRAKIQNGVITDAEGDRWILAKPAGQGSTPIDDDPLPDMTWLPAFLRKLDFPWELIDVAISVAALAVILFVAFTQKP
jgi:hypothetical protein